MATDHLKRPVQQKNLKKPREPWTVNANAAAATQAPDSQINWSL